MILGDVEEIVTTIEIDDETYEEIVRVLDYIEDIGLKAIAKSCKDLQELRVFPSDPFGNEPNVSLIEQGLVTVSEGCPKLQSVLYFCLQMSNAALLSIVKNRPNLICFRLCILDPRAPDYLTLESGSKTSNSADVAAGRSRKYGELAENVSKILDPVSVDRIDMSEVQICRKGRP